ncbi:MAG: DUF4129 domain-containing protein [Nitrospinota bacterium]|nr:MAG: DUF4129 domain-containing protein [Nitrospinota bacterium]
MEKPQTGKFSWGASVLIGIFLLLLGISVINLGTRPEEVGGRYKLLPVLPAVLYQVLFTLALLCVLVSIALVVSSHREQRRREEAEQEENRKRSFLTQMFLSLCPFLLLTLLILYLYTYHRQEMEVNLQHLFTLFRDLSSLLQGESPLPAYSSSLFGYLLFGILSLLFLAFIVVGCWLLQGGVLDLQEGEEEAGATEDLLQAVDTSIEALSRHRDTRSGIIAAYRQFEHLLAAHGLPRRPAATPLEFMQEALYRFPVPREHVAGLTTLFHQAKFSLHPLGEGERAAAISHLEAIRAALQSGEVNADVYHT